MDEDWARRPVNFVSWADAARFANWLHNGQPSGDQTSNTTETGSYDLRATQQYYGSDGSMPDHNEDEVRYRELQAAMVAATRSEQATWVIPSVDEWHKAAYHKNNGLGADYFEYPTSSDSVPSNGPDDNGNSATYRDYFDVFTHTPKYTVDAPYWRTEVGAHAGSPSPYGTFDQGGNVTEWTDTDVPDYYCMWRGGSFQNAGPSTLAATASNHTEINRESDQYGFRVVHLPEPCTLMVFCLAVPAVMHRRRSACNDVDRR